MHLLDLPQGELGGQKAKGDAAVVDLAAQALERVAKDRVFAGDRESGA